MPGGQLEWVGHVDHEANMRGQKLFDGTNAVTGPM